MSEEIEEEGTIEIRYRIYCNIPRLEKVRIFGEKFVKNNRYNCKIIYNYREFNLHEFFAFDPTPKGYYSIKLKKINNIIDASDMFYGCKSLIFLPDISKCQMLLILVVCFMDVNH